MLRTAKLGKPDESMIDFDEYIKSVAGGQPIKEFRGGMESARVVRIGEWVYKLRWQNAYEERLKLHNKYFGGSTGYEILGWAESNDHSGLLLKQPFIDLIPNSNAKGQKLLAEDLLGKYGRVLVVDDEMWADGTLFDNLGHDNVGVNKSNGNYAVVDCLISKLSEEDVRDLWIGCDYTIKELSMKQCGKFCKKNLLKKVETMANVKSELCVREDSNTALRIGAARWREVSKFAYDVDISQCTSSCDVAILLGNYLLNHLKHPQNPMGLRQLLDGPLYTYGEVSATATIYFEGMLSDKSSSCMKVSSRCEWAERKPITAG